MNRYGAFDIQNGEQEPFINTNKKQRPSSWHSRIVWILVLTVIVAVVFLSERRNPTKLISGYMIYNYIIENIFLTFF